MPCSREQCLKNLKHHILKGNKPWNTGIVSPLKGRKRPTRSIEWSNKISIAKKGKTAWNKGKEMSQQQKDKISLANKGKKLTDFQKSRFIQRGENHYLWKKDRSSLKDDSKDRKGQLHREWSKSVKNRDKWVCRIADVKCNGKLEAHHILGWKSHPELRYKINNGITLCHAHHPRKREDESKLSPYFQKLVAEMN